MAALLSKSEQSYIQSSLLVSSPLRADGRKLHDYRCIALETGVVSLANGSARVGIGNVGLNGVGTSLSTEVLAAVKLEVQNTDDHIISDAGDISCSVSWSVSILFEYHSVHASDQFFYFLSSST